MDIYGLNYLDWWINTEVQKKIVNYTDYACFIKLDKLPSCNIVYLFIYASAN